MFSFLRRPPEPPPPMDPDDEQGLIEAQEAFEQVLSQWADVAQVTEDLRGIRRRNHLAELAHDAMGARRR